MGKRRIIYIDALKGLAIILVVMGHLYCFSYGNSDSKMFDFISSFHMPLFMWLSGFVLYKDGNAPYCSAVKLWQKTRRLLVPMLFFGLCFSATFSSLSTTQGWCQMVSSFLLAPAKNGYWYLMSLSVFYVSLQLFRLNRNDTKLCNLFIALAAYTLMGAGWKLLSQNKDLFCLLNCTDFYPFFITGYFSHKYGWIDYMKRNNWIFSVCMIFYVLLFGQEFSSHIVNTLSVRFIVRFCAVAVCVYLFFMRESEFTNVERWLSYVGQHTLDIYVLHYFIVKQINLMTLDRWLQWSNNFFLSVLLTLALALIITVVCIGIGNVLRKSELLQKVAYGIW